MTLYHFCAAKHIKSILFVIGAEYLKYQENQREVNENEKV